ncbi:hypothetical protein AAFF_G00198300, partial [Aldrovandia affinis]
MAYGRRFKQIDKIENGEVYQRRRGPQVSPVEEPDVAPGPRARRPTGSSWRRIVLLILAITIHNIP